MSAAGSARKSEPRSPPEGLGGFISAVGGGEHRAHPPHLATATARSMMDDLARAACLGTINRCKWGKNRKVRARSFGWIKSGKVRINSGAPPPGAPPRDRDGAVTFSPARLMGCALPDAQRAFPGL